MLNIKNTPASWFSGHDLFPNPSKAALYEELMSRFRLQKSATT
jgi:hypothetical protein